MAIEVFLDQIRKRLSPPEGQMVVKSLQQDPLIWQFIVNDEESQQYFSSMDSDLAAYQPWRMAKWLIETQEDVALDQLEDLGFDIQASTRKRSAQALETVFNTGLPPADLFSAGLLFLMLRESRIRKSNWHGISDEIFLKNSPSDPLKNFHIWRTPFALAYTFFPDFSDIVSDFLSSDLEPKMISSIPLLINAILSNPLPQDEAVTEIFSSIQHLSLKWQLESLKWLKTFNRNDLVNRISSNLIQTKPNRDKFAHIFTEIETFEVGSDGSDGMEKQVRSGLPEDISRLAAFHYYSGDKQKAADLYQRASQVLDFQKNQASFQSLSIQRDQTSSAQWMKTVQSIPNSKQARLMFIHSLISEGNYEQATTHLEKLPDSFEKDLLKLQIVSANPSRVDTPINISKILSHQTIGKASGSPNHLIHQSEFKTAKELLRTLNNQTFSGVDTSRLEFLTNNFMNDAEVISLARDVYERYQDYDKAVGLTSYLERLDHTNINHKRSLARLYSILQRWQDAFTTLQALIKSEENPQKGDLENYAEAALRTDHIDMSISICQNILKQEPRNTKALTLLGEGYMLKGDVIKSIQHMEQVVEMIPEEPETWLTLARLWQNMGKTDRSFEILNKGVLAIPNDPALLREIGKANLEKKAPAEAIKHLRKACEIEPNNLEGKLNFAHAEFELGRYDQAWQLLKPLMGEYQKNPLAAKLLGKVLLAMDEKQAAEPILLFAADQFPDDTEIVIIACELALNNAESLIEQPSSEKFNRLGNILQKAALINKEDPRIRLYQTEVDRLLDLNQEAFDSYCRLSEEAFDTHSNISWRIPYGMGKAAMALGKPEIGLASLKDANKMNPGNLIIFRALSEAYQAANLHGKAQDTALTTLRLAPQDMENILWYAKFMNERNEPGEAVRALKEALQINPARSELKLWLSKIQKSMGDLDEARETLFDLITNSSSDPQELHKAAYLCVQLNELELAVNALEKSKLNLVDSNPILLLDLAVIYSLLDQRKKALQLLNLDDAYLRENPQLVLLKSDILSNLGQYDLTLSTLNLLDKNAESVLVGNDPEKTLADQSPLIYTYDFSYKGYLYRLGQIHRALGNMEEAKRYSAKALSLAPNDRQVQNAALECHWMSNGLGEAHKIGAQAVAQLDESSRTDGDLIDLICTYTELLLEEGKVDEAKVLINDLTKAAVNYSRYHAIQSILAVNLDQRNIAKSYLDDAVALLEQNKSSNIEKTLPDKFREVININSIAKAALSNDQYQLALKLNRLAFQKFSNQPLINLSYAKALILSAENQRIADAIHAVNHMTDKDSLSLDNQELCRQLVQNLQDFVPGEVFTCLKLRASTAFSGSFPANLNHESCLRDPESAAAVLVGCDDQEVARKILESYPQDPDILRAYGIFANKHKKKDGRDYVEKALHYDTSDPIKHVLLALLNNKDHKAALNSLETALAFWPDEPEWHALAAEHYAAVGENKNASDHISAALKFQPDNPGYWQRSADIRIGNNDISHAIEDLKKSTAIENKDPDIWIKLADLNRRMGNISEAYKNFKTAGEIDPDNIDFASKEINFLLDQKDYKAAEFRAVQILENDNNNHNVQILLAQVQAKQGKFEMALDTLAAASKKNPENTLLRLEKLKIRKERDNTEEVLPDLISLAETNPNHPAVLTTLTDWLIQMNRIKEAEITAQSILRNSPENASVHLMLGRLQKKKGQLDQAVAHLSDAIAYDPMLIDAYIELGKTYQERNDLEQAISIYQRGTKVNASDPRPYFYAGIALKECKDYVGAEKMLKQAKRYDPHDTRISRQLGVIKALNLINNLRETS